MKYAIKFEKTKERGLTHEDILKMRQALMDLPERIQLIFAIGILDSIDLEGIHKIKRAEKKQEKEPHILWWEGLDPSERKEILDRLSAFGGPRDISLHEMRAEYQNRGNHE